MKTMSFSRHVTESMSIKKETDSSVPVYAIGSDYSLMSCSPAELNAASSDKSNVQNQIAQHRLLPWNNQNISLTNDPFGTGNGEYYNGKKCKAWINVCCLVNLITT